MNLLLNQRLTPRLLGCLLCLFFLSACQNEARSDAAAQPFATAGDAPEFPEGAQWFNTEKPLTMQELRGKIVLLDFWTYCCINCMHVLPDLKRLEQEYPELVVVGVHSAKFRNEKVPENIRQAILRYDIEHPVVVDNGMKLWREYGVRAWPSFALVDPEGNVAGKTSGEGVYKKMQPVIQAMSERFAEKGMLKKERRDFSLERERRAGSYLAFPGKITGHEASGRLFFTDSNHNRIIVAKPSGEVLQIIGSGASGAKDGSFDACSFFRPQGLAYDEANDVLYIADTDNHLIRKADFRTRTVTTLLGTGLQCAVYTSEADGTTEAINSPWDVALKDGDLYIAMAGPHQLWKLDLETNKAVVWAGSGRENIADGPRKKAALAQPSGLVWDDGALYFADSEVSALRKVEDGEVSTLIGRGLFEFGDIDGKYPKARLQHCLGVDAKDGKLYIADAYNHKIRVYDKRSGVLSSLLGDGESGYVDGAPASARFSEPNDVYWFKGKLYITDTNNHLVRVFDPKTGKVSTFQFKAPKQLAMIEKKRAAPQEALPFFGQTIELPAQSIPGAAAELELIVGLPKGYKLNRAAPHFATVVSGGKEQELLVELADDDALRISSDLMPLGELLKFHVGMYYCDEANEARCYIKELELRQPLNIKNGKSGETLRVQYELPAKYADM